MSQDSEFEKYLEGKTDLSKLYAELPKIELPDHLDAAILAEAHRAVNARPGAKPKRRWAIPLSMVATLFLAVMIGLQLPSLLKDAASPQQYKEEKITAMMDSGIAGQPSESLEIYKKIQEKSNVRPQENSEVIRAETAMEAAEEATPVRPSAPIVMTPQKSVAAKNNASNSALVAPVAPLVTTAPRAENPLGFSGSGHIDHSQELAKEKKASGLVQDRQSDSLEREAPAVMMTAPNPVQLKHALVQPETVDKSLPPDEWLVRIKRLKQEGKLDEARRELAAFIKRYPDHPVPVTLEIK